MARTSPAWASTFSPMTKNVARAPARRATRAHAASSPGSVRRERQRHLGARGRTTRVNGAEHAQSRDYDPNRRNRGLQQEPPHGERHGRASPEQRQGTGEQARDTREPEQQANGRHAERGHLAIFSRTAAAPAQNFGAVLEPCRKIVIFPAETT